MVLDRDFNHCLSQCSVDELFRLLDGVLAELQARQVPIDGPRHPHAASYDSPDHPWEPDRYPHAASYARPDHPWEPDIGLDSGLRDEYNIPNYRWEAEMRDLIEGTTHRTKMLHELRMMQIQANYEGWKKAFYGK